MFLSLKRLISWLIIVFVGWVERSETQHFKNNFKNNVELRYATPKLPFYCYGYRTSTVN
jgi:hypothetical protein